MRAAVISDTHLDAPTDWFRRFFQEHLADTDALIHCGDCTGVALYEYMLANHPNVHAVAGNCCDWRLSRELPAMLRLSLAGHSIGVTHGWGDRPSLAARLPEAFGPGFDLIVFGHTHRQTSIRFGDTLVVNPGALSGECPSMAFITLGHAIEVDFRSFPRSAG